LRSWLPRRSESPGAVTEDLHRSIWVGLPEHQLERAWRRSSSDRDLLHPRGQELARAAQERKEPFRAWLRERLDGLDLPSTMALLEACLDDTPLAETVQQRRTRALATDARQRLRIRPTT
jgi:hypothetical protein